MLQYGQPGGEITIAADAKNAKPKKKKASSAKKTTKKKAATKKAKEPEAAEK